MNASYRCIVLAATLLLAQGRASGEDIELFLDRNAGTDPPQVLFVIDNAANFSENLDDPQLGSCSLGGSVNSLAGKVGGIEQCALYSVIEELEAESVEIGVMVYNDGTVVDWEGRQCDGVPDALNQKPGGCLVYPMQLLTDTSRAGLLDWIRSWRVDGGSVPGQIKGSAKRTGASMQEA